MKQKRPRKRTKPSKLIRGLFSVFLQAGDDLYMHQVWASSAESAAAAMAPWAKGRVERGAIEPRLPVELVHWDLTDPRVIEDNRFLEDYRAIDDEGETTDEAGWGKNRIRLQHVWSAEGEVDGERAFVYVIETVPDSWGLRDAQGFPEDMVPATGLLLDL